MKIDTFFVFCIFFFALQFVTLNTSHSFFAYFQRRNNDSKCNNSLIIIIASNFNLIFIKLVSITSTKKKPFV